jgi:excisionase family DNA binding protein
MRKFYSTREAAKKLNVSLITLQRHIAARKFRVPKLQRVGGVRVRLWSAGDIERTRIKLADVKPGRKKKKA